MQKFSFEYEDSKRGGHLRNMEKVAAKNNLVLDEFMAKSIVENAFAIHEAFHELKSDVNDDTSSISQLLSSLGWTETSQKQVLIAFVEQVMQTSLSTMKKTTTLPCKILVL